MPSRYDKSPVGPPELVCLALPRKAFDLSLGKARRSFNLARKSWLQRWVVPLVAGISHLK